MNIGIVTTWFERGAAYVSKAYMETLSKKHDVFIYARGGEEYARDDPRWDLPNVTWGKQYEDINQGMYIIWKDFKVWLKENQIDLIIFNEQQSWDIFLKLRNKKYIIGAYVDYYTLDTIHLFSMYDFLLCNTKRHFSVFKNHKQAFYVPWGTDTNLFTPREKINNKDIVVFFHSAGMGGFNLRKGTDILVKAFKKVQGNAKLIIHSQVGIEKYKPVIDIIKNDSRIEFMEGTYPPPSLYHKGDVYVYPTRLEGIGLSIAEALSCGLPVITTDNPPMNEFVQHGETGFLVEVEEYKTRRDGYYWPESICSVESLTYAMQLYVNNPALVKDQSTKARNYALKYLNWDKNSKNLANVLSSLKIVRSWDRRDIKLIRKKSRLSSLYLKLTRRNLAANDKVKGLKYFMMMLWHRPQYLLRRKTYSIIKSFLR